MQKPWFHRISTLLIVGLLVGSHGCETLKLRVSDPKLQSIIAAKTGADVNIRNFSSKNRSIRYATVGDASNPPLVLLHGSPSSLSGWRSLYTDTNFTNKYYLILIDRPGYGFSQFGNVVTSIAEQAALVNDILKELQLRQPARILGSSYGGPVALQAAMQAPDLYNQIVLLSASVKPSAEKVYDISYLMVVPVIEWLFPKVFTMASKEKLSHSKELEKITDWQKIKSPVTILHGDADELIYYENALYAQENLAPHTSVDLITLKNKGHALIFSEPDYLKALLLLYLQQ
jgi:pimeloyl-ACP methyl ester carboxylesterase